MRHQVTWSASLAVIDNELSHECVVIDLSRRYRIASYRMTLPRYKPCQSYNFAKPKLRKASQGPYPIDLEKQLLCYLTMGLTLIYPPDIPFINSTLVPPPYPCKPLSRYKPCKSYNFAKPKLRRRAKDCTQLIWKNSSSLGLGILHSDKGTFVTAVFRWVGDEHVGSFEHMILKPVSHTGIGH
jgi:hypothetical protein